MRMATEQMPDSIVADLLSAALKAADEAGRRGLHVWEQKALAWLAAGKLDGLDPWLAKCVRAYAAGKPVLKGWEAQPHPIRITRDSEE